MSEIANRVRAARGYADLTQKDLAAELGLDAQAVKRTEGGRRDPKPSELRDIARVCGLPYEWFTVDDLGGAVKFAAGMDAADSAIREGRQPTPRDPVLEQLASMREDLRLFRKSWDDLALPAIGLIQAAAQERLDQEDEANHETEAREQNRPAERRAG